MQRCVSFDPFKILIVLSQNSDSKISERLFLLWELGHGHLHRNFKDKREIR